MPHKIVPLRTFMSEWPESEAKEILSNFSCSRSEGVQRYLRKTAVKHEESQISRTYLIMDDEPTERLVAYITIAMKCLNMEGEQCDDSDMIKSMNVNNGIAQSYIIGQLGKTDGYDKKVGDMAMDFALDIIQSANKLVGCRVVRLDCKDALIKYYESKGFNLLNKNSGNDMNRMLMVLA